MLGDLVVASLGVQVAAHSAGVAPRLSEIENVSGHGVGQAALRWVDHVRSNAPTQGRGWTLTSSHFRRGGLPTP